MYNKIINLLNNEKVIAYPTEYMFGLGCNPNSELAVYKLLKLKKRTDEKGFILIAYNYKQLLPYINLKLIPNNIKFFLFNKFIEPITWIVPANSNVPIWLTGKYKNFIAIRVTKNSTAKKLCFFYKKPIISTSANINNNKPCYNIEEIYKIFGNNFPVLNGKINFKKKQTKIINLLTSKIIRKN